MALQAIYSAIASHGSRHFAKKKKAAITVISETYLTHLPASIATVTTLGTQGGGENRDIQTACNKLFTSAITVS